MNQHGSILDDLERDEGRRHKPYVDCCGKSFRDCSCAVMGRLTVGVGRNIEDVGLSDDEIDFLLKNDVERVNREIRSALPWVMNMTPARVSVVQNMLFNLGLPTMLTFKNTLAYMERGNYRAAAAGMRASKWARQVGARAERLARLMEG